MKYKTINQHMTAKFVFRGLSEATNTTQQNTHTQKTSIEIDRQKERGKEITAKFREEHADNACAGIKVNICGALGSWY